MHELNCKPYSIQSVISASLLTRFNMLRLQLGIDRNDHVEHEKRSWLIVDKRTGNDLSLGFVLIPAARRKGVMSAVLPQFVTRLQEKLYAETSVENTGAIRVLEISGFTPSQPEHPTHVMPYGETVRTLAFRYVP